jgi:hypothetical protein
MPQSNPDYETSAQAPESHLRLAQGVEPAFPAALTQLFLKASEFASLLYLCGGFPSAFQTLT